MTIAWLRFSPLAHVARRAITLHAPFLHEYQLVWGLSATVSDSILT